MKISMRSGDDDTVGLILMSNGEHQTFSMHSDFSVHCTHEDETD